MKNLRENDEYKLYKSVREILHPSISKKNISNYKIIVKEELLPIKVYYPNKVSNIDKVIIYVRGSNDIIEYNNKYKEILSMLSKDLDRLIISIEYNEDEQIEKQENSIYNTFKYLYEGLKTNNIKSNNISLIGDSTGSNIIINSIDKMKKNSINDIKLILFYPALIENSIEEGKKRNNYEMVKNIKKYYQSKLGKKTISINDIIKLNYNDYEEFPNTLIICGKVDPLLDEIKVLKEKISNSELKLISFASRNFLCTRDDEIINEYKTILNDFFNIELKNY